MSTRRCWSCLRHRTSAGTRPKTASGSAPEVAPDCRRPVALAVTGFKDELVQSVRTGLTFDPVGGPFVEKLAAAAAPGGIIFEYGVLSSDPTPFPLVTALVNSLSVRGYILLEVTHNPAALVKATKYISERLQDGRFVPKIAKVFPRA